MYFMEIAYKNKEKKMANEQKIKIGKWIEFGITCITLLAKFIKEVVEIIPEKN